MEDRTPPNGSPRINVTVGGDPSSNHRDTETFGLARLDSSGADVGQICLRIVPPAAQPFEDCDDDRLGDLEGLLVDVVHAVQGAREVLTASSNGRSIVVLLPADVHLGEPGDVLAGALCGAVTSFCRTAAIELRKDALSVNVVFHGAGSEAEVSATNALLDTLFVGGVTLTGQEIYAAPEGPNLGRIRQ